MKNVLPPCIWLLLAPASWAAHEVIVIGAGASGLMAARRLVNEGGIDVTVLEARPDRYGGRIWTNTAGFPNATGPEVEMGAGFVHHPTAENAVAQLLRNLDIPILEINVTTVKVVQEKDGSVFDRKTIYTTWENLYEAFNVARMYGIARGIDESIEASLIKSNVFETIESPLAQTFIADVEFHYCAPIDKVSTILSEDFENNADSDDFVTPKGYREMLDMLVQSKPSESRLDVRLGKEVTHVSVLTNGRVAVTCKDGSRYEADAVVVTLPLGVLKAEVVNFTPKLPQVKLDAIQRIGFGVVNKVILEFDRVFWPENIYYLYTVLKNSTQRGELVSIANLFPVSRTPILVCYAISHFGAISESWSDTDLKTLALSRLRVLFGSIMDDVTVVNMARTRWLADPFSRGSYSFPSVGVNAEDWDKLGEPTPPLFFAGEHTDSDRYGTVEAAIKTGWNAAGHTIDYLNAAGGITATGLSNLFPLIVISIYWLSWEL